jgi:valyl-tRNA synthetase
MNEAVAGVNEALTARDFSRSTKLAYQFFYDELCDVFIENSKSILQDGTPEQQTLAQNTLYKCLDTALRLLHPFLPFITEELWQRLPRKQGDDTKTIMLAEYPEFEENLKFEAEAKDYELGVK